MLMVIVYILCYEFCIALSIKFVFTGKKGEDPTKVEWDVVTGSSLVCNEDDYLYEIRFVGNMMKYSIDNVYTMTYEHVYIKFSALFLSQLPCNDMKANVEKELHLTTCSSLAELRSSCPKQENRAISFYDDSVNVDGKTLSLQNTDSCTSDYELDIMTILFILVAVVVVVIICCCCCCMCCCSNNNSRVNEDVSDSEEEDYSEEEEEEEDPKQVIIMPIPQPVPQPMPIPQPVPQPMPMPQPVPQPMPMPQPVPQPMPILQPVPQPMPMPIPQPVPPVPPVPHI